MTNNDPRYNLDAIVDYIDRNPLVGGALAEAFGAPYWQMYLALRHLRWLGRITHICSQGGRGWQTL